MKRHWRDGCGDRRSRPVAGNLDPDDSGPAGRVGQRRQILDACIECAIDGARCQSDIAGCIERRALRRDLGENQSMLGAARQRRGERRLACEQAGERLVPGIEIVRGRGDLNAAGSSVNGAARGCSTEDGAAVVAISAAPP